MRRWVTEAQQHPDPLWVILNSLAVTSQVRISYFGEASGVPVGRAMLYLTCVGKWEYLVAESGVSMPPLH